jgi:hypothetical protein
MSNMMASRRVAFHRASGVALVLLCATFTATASASQQVSGKLSCGPDQSGKKGWSTPNLRGVYTPTTIMLLWEAKWEDKGIEKTRIRHFRGQLQKDGKISVQGEGVSLGGGGTWPYQFSGKLKSASMTPGSFPIQLDGTEGSGAQIILRSHYAKMY